MSDKKEKKEKQVKGFAQEPFEFRGVQYQPGDVVECEESKMKDLTDPGVNLVGSTKPKTKEAKGGVVKA